MQSDTIQHLRERVRALVAPPALRGRVPREASTWCEAFGVTIQGGSVHEILSPASAATTPRQFALLLARASLAAVPNDARVIAWVEDRTDPWYAPAVARAAKVPIERILILHPPAARDAKPALWALAECLGSPGVCATIARVPDKLSSIDARRLQLAAERGGGIGVLLRRHHPARPLQYSAAMRWLVEPLPAEISRSQRWRITLLHGHGGRIGQPVALEVDRETDRVCALEELADQSIQTAPGRRAIG